MTREPGEVQRGFRIQVRQDRRIAGGKAMLARALALVPGMASQVDLRVVGLQKTNCTFDFHASNLKGRPMFRQNELV